MKKYIIHFPSFQLRLLLLLMAMIVITGAELKAQDSTAAAPVVKKKSYVKNTFEGNFLIDNQTVMVPIKGTFEFDIQHRFGTIDHQFTDLFGLFSGANMRLGFSYTPIKDLQVGFGANNYNMIVDYSLKYAFVKQTKDGKIPVSITYFGHAAMDTRAKNDALPIVTTSDRFAFFNQILIARKFTEALSLQGSFNYTHFNNVDGYKDASGVIQPAMKNDHLSFSLGARYKISPKTSIIFNYEQPLTEHYINDVMPNLSLGLDMRSSGHDFQVFFGNYGNTIPSYNSLYNQNDFSKGQYVIGFNISRLWNF
jgi:hypothetical protein